MTCFTMILATQWTLCLPPNLQTGLNVCQNSPVGLDALALLQLAIKIAARYSDGKEG